MRLITAMRTAGEGGRLGYPKGWRGRKRDSPWLSQALLARAHPISFRKSFLLLEPGFSCSSSGHSWDLQSGSWLGLCWQLGEARSVTLQLDFVRVVGSGSGKDGGGLRS